jgi:hypothetical protein
MEILGSHLSVLQVLVVMRLGWNFYVRHWSSTMYGQASEKA